MIKQSFFVALGLLGSINNSAAEWSGFVSSELRYFPETPLFSEQYQHANFSLVMQPMLRHEWDRGYQTFTFVPFLRWDQHDHQRSHADIRELTWLKAAENWELRLGIRKLFWGVTESQHLVDIINQTDAVEDIDGEEKLGQPMINLALIRPWGTVDLLVLPGFRTRTFPGVQGRLYGGLPIDTDQTRYESAAEEKHVDGAIRWTHTLDLWDIGVAHFVGTSREPRFLVQDLRLIPYYEQIYQTSLDVQATQADWLWKLEWITRSGQQDRFTALTGGFEYTFVGVLDSAIDIGLLGEYLFDDRKDNAPTLFQNDLMVGLRWLFNDIQSTELLASAIVDLDSHACFYMLEASRRLGDSWILSLEARFFARTPREDFAYAFRQEDYVQVALTWYF